MADLSHIESSFTTLENQLKGLTIQQPMAIQGASMTCSHYQSLDDTLSALP